jgi:hypothetical protein
MEFSTFRGFIDTKSYLTLDDLFGPGSYSYKKLIGIPSCDFALYKIYTYALSESLENRKTFVKELCSTFEELGNLSLDFIDPLLLSLVTSL